MTNETVQHQITVLNVPYAEKDEAKKLGAKWDPNMRKWFVPLGIDTEPFAEWITDESFDASADGRS